MDLLSRIAAWLGENEATISAVVGITVLAGILFAGVRWLLLRGTAGTPEKPFVRPGRGTILIAASAAVLLLLAGVIAWLVLPDTPAIETTSEDDPLLALPTGPVVAVLPFENLSRDPDQEFFSDGLTDEIITELSRFKDLFVIARNSTFQYKGQAVDVRQLREDLGARYVLEGSVQKAGTSLRVTAQLLDAMDGTHLWAESYDRELSAPSVFAVQDEITERVVGAIAGRYGVISRSRFAEVREKPTENLKAYECVLQTDAYRYRGNLAAPEHARLRDCLERAVKSDPGYAEAWARLSGIYLDEYKFNHNPRPKPLDRVLDAARRAVDLDPTSQVARTDLAEAYFYRHELDAFFPELERALALNPNRASTLWDLGLLLIYLGDERGIALVKKAVALDPQHPTGIYHSIALYHFERDEYEEALVVARRVDAPDVYWTHLVLAAIYAELGRESEARSALEEATRLDPSLSGRTLIEEMRKFNRSDEVIDHWASAFRKAGLPE